MMFILYRDKLSVRENEDRFSKIYPKINSKFSMKPPRSSIIHDLDRHLFISISSINIVYEFYVIQRKIVRS